MPTLAWACPGVGGSRVRGSVDARIRGLDAAHPRRVPPGGLFRELPLEAADEVLLENLSRPMLPDFLLPQPPDVPRIARAGQVYAMALGASAGMFAWKAVAEALAARSAEVSAIRSPTTSFTIFFLVVVVVVTVLPRIWEGVLGRWIAARGPAPASWGIAGPEDRKAIAGAWLASRYLMSTRWEVMAAATSAAVWSTRDFSFLFPLVGAFAMLLYNTPTEASAQREVDEMIESWNALSALKQR